jgi:hypothetical protein
VWIWAFLHLGIRIRSSIWTFLIWAFIFEFWHLGILNRTNILNNKHAYWLRWLLLLLPRAASLCAGRVALKTASVGGDEGRRRVVYGSKRAFSRAAK